LYFLLLRFLCIWQIVRLYQSKTWYEMSNSFKFLISFYKSELCFMLNLLSHIGEWSTFSHCHSDASLIFQRLLGWAYLLLFHHWNFVRFGHRENCVGE
jgi:hypothetical protein